jgi:hypothetical protein
MVQSDWLFAENHEISQGLNLTVALSANQLSSPTSQGGGVHYFLGFEEMDFVLLGLVGLEELEPVAEV